jgi:hypothetical protein
MTNTEQLLRFQLQVIGGAFLEGFTETNVSNLTQQQKEALATIASVLAQFSRQNTVA